MAELRDNARLSSKPTGLRMVSAFSEVRQVAWLIERLSGLGSDASPLSGYGGMVDSLQGTGEVQQLWFAHMWTMMFWWAWLGLLFNRSLIGYSGGKNRIPESRPSVPHVPPLRNPLPH